MRVFAGAAHPRLARPFPGAPGDAHARNPRQHSMVRRLRDPLPCTCPPANQTKQPKTNLAWAWRVGSRHDRHDHFPLFFIFLRFPVFAFFRWWCVCVRVARRWCRQGASATIFTGGRTCWPVASRACVTGLHSIRLTRSSQGCSRPRARCQSTALAGGSSTFTR